jgi:hypothetical protein
VRDSEVIWNLMNKKYQQHIEKCCEQIQGIGQGEELEYEVDSQEDEYVNTNWRMKIEDSEVD